MKSSQEIERVSDQGHDTFEIPAIVQKALRSGGQQLDHSTRAKMRPFFGKIVNQVRVHTNGEADKSAEAVNARAYTVGRKVVFRSGQYAPQSQRGRNLLAHELTHVKQGRPNTLMRSAFDNEDPALRRRRLATIRKAHVVINRLINALSRGYIWRVETVTQGGVYLLHMAVVESIAAREARLKGIVVALIRMVRELEAAPIPSTWLAPEVSGQASRLIAGSERDPAMTDLVMFYAHRGKQMGLDIDLLYNNITYIIDAPRATPKISRASISGGISTGIYIKVPDPVNEPLVYQRLTGFEGWSAGSVVLDVMHDSFGYYYVYKGAKHYLPARP